MIFFLLKPCLWCKNTPGQMPPEASLPTLIITVVTMF